MKQYNDIRDAVFGELYEIAQNDKDVVVLTADTGVALFEDFAKNLPGRFYNVGIAEQNAISVAAGLSKVGKKPYVFGIANFITLRSLEQIRVDLCAMKSPVVILGIGAGFAYSQDGPTHHMTENLAIMSSLPNLTVWNTSDYSMTANLMHLAYKHQQNNWGPCFLSFDKGPFDSIYPIEETDFSSGIAAHGHGSIALVATGIAVKWAMEIAKEIDVTVYDLYRLSPVDQKLLATLLYKHKAIITLEEHNERGGLGMLVADCLMSKGIYRPFKKLCVPNAFIYDIGDREMFRRINKLDRDSILNAYLELANA